MSTIYTMLVRNAYLRDPGDVFDIAIQGDRIVDISKEITGHGEIEIDACAKFVSPGLIDAHTHMDKALTLGEGRQPKYWEMPYNRDRSIDIGLEYYSKATKEEVYEQAVKHGHMQVANGTVYTRTHVDVDSIARTKAVEGVIDAREELKDLIDIQIVAFAQSGFYPDPEAEKLVGLANEMGCHLVGGVDPGTKEYNIEGSLDICFKIAREHDVDIDYHIMEPGTLGVYILERLARKTIENKYQGRVTASHAFSLGDAPLSWIDQAIPLFKESGLKFVTCFTTTPPTFPVKKLYEAGIPIGCGSDDIRDFWIPFGNGDMVEGALIETQRLSLSANRDLDLIWDMITGEGAKVLGIEKDYGLGVGKKADLVILDANSPQWAIIEQPKKLYVIKNGKIVAKNGALVP